MWSPIPRETGLMLSVCLFVCTREEGKNSRSEKEESKRLPLITREVISTADEKRQVARSYCGGVSCRCGEAAVMYLQSHRLPHPSHA